MSDDLRNLIQGISSELNPGTPDNQEEAPAVTADEYLAEDEEAVETDVETPEEVSEETDEEVDESDDAEETEVDEDSEDTDGEKYTVKVDGESFEVTIDELKSGYQRQADYTREKQALKAQVEEFQAVRNSFAEEIGALEELNAAWEENPITVLSHFTANTDNPTQALALLIQDLAAANVLDSQFLSIFGITPEIQNQLARDREINQLRSARNSSESAAERKYAEAQQELAIQQAIAEYDAQIDDIIEAEDLNFNTKQRAAFRQELAAYAAENELTNLKAAYKAFKYEEAQKNKALAKKTVAKAQQKKAASVVSRSGGGEGAPVQDNSDLNAVIRAAMKEATSS
jgi:hypothetical protein